MLPAMTRAMQRTSRQSKAGIASKNRPHGAHAGLGPQGKTRSAAGRREASDGAAAIRQRPRGFAPFSSPT